VSGCQLEAIYAALAATTVTVGAKTVAARNLDRLKGSIEAAEMPTRLLLLPNDSRGGGGEFGFVALGNTSSSTWNIPDLLLWRLAEDGMGLEDVATELRAYTVAYTNLLRTIRALTDQSVIERVSLRTGVFSWGGRDYFGVLAVLTIKEWISG
jgi:hypothetical protein